MGPGRIANAMRHWAAVWGSEPKIEELVALYSMISRMRVSCLPRTIMCAENIMGVTVDTYFAPNKTIRDLHELVKSGAGIDPLKDFAETARESYNRHLLRCKVTIAHPKGPARPVGGPQAVQPRDGRSLMRGECRIARTCALRPVDSL